MDFEQSDSSLEHFLENRFGGDLDSSGHFTISAEDALRKLAEFQLPQPHYWILKLVQAATIGKAPVFRAEFGNTVIIAKFEPETVPTPDELIQALTSLQLKERTLAAHLATGLRTLGTGSRRQFMVWLSGSFGTSAIFWDGQELVEVKETSSPQLKEIRVEATLVDWREKLGEMLRMRGGKTEELSVLHSSAYTAPLKLELDGETTGIPSISSQRCISLPIWCGSTPGTQLRPPSWFSQVQEMTQHNATPVTSCRNFWCIQYCFHLHHRPLNYAPHPVDVAQGRGFIIWLKDGIVVEVVPVDLKDTPFMVTYFASADELKTDLTGFELTHDEEYKRRSYDALASFNTLLTADLSSFIHSQWKKPQSEPSWDITRQTILRFPMGMTVPYLERSEVTDIFLELPKVHDRIEAQMLAFANRSQSSER